MIAWWTKKLSRDPGQLGLFEVPTPVPDSRGASTRELQTAPERVAVCGPDRSDAPKSLAPKTVATKFDPPAATDRDAEAFFHTLRAHGLRGIDELVLTRNRRTMVSLARGVLRVHEGFAHAPPHVHAAIATFAMSRNRAKRAAARDIIVEFPVPIRSSSRRPVSQHPDDAPMAARLTTLHAQLNLEHFGGALVHLEILVSRRLARRLGHYTPRSHNGGIGEIVMSRRHVRRDGWPEAIHTLLHEMVHQWQDETGRPIDHGGGFRAKCRAVGIEPAATRMLAR